MMEGSTRPLPRRFDPSSDVWTAPDLAEYLGLSKNSVYGMLARGEIPGQFRFGRSWRVSRLAFLRAFHGQVEAPQ